MTTNLSWQPPLVNTDGEDWLGHWFDRVNARRQAENDYQARVDAVAWDTDWAAWWTMLLCGRFNKIMWERFGWCAYGIHQRHNTSGRLLTIRAVGAGNKELVAFYQGSDWSTLFQAARRDLRAGTVTWKESKPFATG